MDAEAEAPRRATTTKEARMLISECGVGEGEKRRLKGREREREEPRSEMVERKRRRKGFIQLDGISC